MKSITACCLAVVSMAAVAGPIQLNPVQKKKLDTFFSNFSEANLGRFSGLGLSDDLLLNFSLRHLYINKFKSLKPTKDGNSVTASAEQVDAVTQRFFGKNISSHKKKAYSIECADGESYIFSQIIGFEATDKGLFKVNGTIYMTGSGGTPDPHGNPASWKQAGEEVEVAGTFSAVVRAEGDRYILLEYATADSVKK
jgi:hypothetical protein